MRAWWLVGLVGCASGKLAVDRVDPPSAPNTAPVPIQIEGSGFHLAVASSLDHEASAAAPMVVELGDLALDSAVWKGEQLIEGTVPAGIPEGSYDVAVTIGGKRAVLVDGYTVANVHPMVDAAIDAPHVCLGTLDIDGNCFTYHADRTGQPAAQAACAALGEHLAIIRNATQNMVVYGLVQGASAYVGLSDLATEGTFLWLDGTAPTYTNWNLAGGEPNSGGGGYEEDCTVMIAGGGGLWDDKACDLEPPLATGNDQFEFICEYP